MESILINASKNYQVFIGRNILKNLGSMINDISKYKKILVISDDIVSKLYFEEINKSLKENFSEVHLFTFENGENSKTLKTAKDVLNYLVEHEFSRTDLIIALGGGVVGDLSGFVASIYLRGIDYIQVPTTFLASIDSSVGGKTALNLNSGKNLVGSFYQPSMVLIDVNTFDTLKKEVFLDGVAEAIKYGLILDKKLFNFLCKEDIKENIEKVISKCVHLKREVVNEDEFDKGLRQILNFGHTIGHAVESVSEHKVSHGRAVAIGMCILEGAFDLKTKKIIYDCLDKYGFDLKLDYGYEEIYKKALNDKKINSEYINLILLEEIGKAYIKKVKMSELKEIIKKGVSAYGH